MPVDNIPPVIGIPIALFLWSALGVRYLMRRYGITIVVKHSRD